MRSIVPFQTANLSAQPFGADVERLFNQFLGAQGASGKTQRSLPLPLELIEEEAAFTVRAELPGVDPAAVVIELEEDVLTLSGEKTSETKAEEDGRSYSERRYGSFRRSIKLPASVDAETVKATHAHGVVSVRLEKAAAQRTRRIEIEPAS